MNKVELWGYTIYKDGKIIGLQGKELTRGKQIKIKWGINGKTRVVSYARFVYYAFNHRTFNFNDKTMVIQYINGNENDYSIDNLTIVDRKYVVQGQYNVSSKLTDEQIEEIKELYRQKKKFNKMKKKKIGKNDPTTNMSYRKLAEKYGVSHSMIAGIVKGQFRNSENYIMR